jgi:DNA polymerase III sliding clamp (beta) subunit (PCNA family)
VRWTANRAELAAAVREVSTDLGSPDRIFGGHALLRLDNNSLTLVGRDASTTVSTTVAVSDGENGAICVDQRRLDEFLHRVTADEVRARLISTKHLRVRAGPAVLDLPTQDADALVVPIVHETGAFSIPTEVMRRCLGRVAAAAHEDSQHPALWGVHLVGSGDAIVAEATDSQRFARAEERVAAGVFSVTLNRRFVTKLMATVDDAPSVRFNYDSQHVAASFGRVWLCGALTHVAFPALGDVMAGAIAASCEVARPELVNAVSALRVVGDDASLWIELSAGKLHFSAHSEEGQSTFDIRSTVDGTPTSRQVSLRNLRAAVQSLDTARTVVSIIDGLHPVVRLEAAEGTASVAWVLSTRPQ